MEHGSSHIKKIKVVSNTHWDREFRRSFEKTRRNLLTMLDTTLDILENDPEYHSFTMDGHSIMIDDYLEMRPERKEQINRFVKEGRLIIGPYYTLAEQFSISHEPMVRNLLWGRKTVEKYGGKAGTVAYTPSSWGQTGQLPQILKDFGLDKMMFYRGISHHEADAEYIWSAPDGTEVLASRFAIYARYNWYYQVHRAVTRGRVFSKDYIWGEYDEVPFKLSDSMYGEDQSFDLKSPAIHYDKTQLEKAIDDMVNAEGSHFTTEVFLAMHGHDISVAHPLESQIITDAKELLGNKYEIEHTDLEGFWSEAEKYLDMEKLPVLTGERRAYLKQGMWTFLFPGTISARTYLKQEDFEATNKLVYFAEPLAALAASLGAAYPELYLDRGWKYLLSNHTHDANGGCAPDAVCEDMEYTYRKAADIGDIVTEDAMSYIARNLSGDGVDKSAMQLVVFNTLPMERDAIVKVDIEIPRSCGAKSVLLENTNDNEVIYQPVAFEKSSVFMDSIWDVPTIMESDHMKFYAKFNKLPALGYRVYNILPQQKELRNSSSLVTGPKTMENEYLKIEVNFNGTVNILNKKTNKLYGDLNYLTDQGECGNAWKHVSPRFDRKYNSLGVSADIAVVLEGPLISAIEVRYDFSVPCDYADGSARNDRLVALSVKIEYRLEAGSSELKVKLEVDNKAKDHWLRVNFPTELTADKTYADSHFDVVSRPIHIPDSTGWVEPAGGTHPLRTFVEINDGKDGFGLMPKGLFEYEAFEDENRTLSLTLIRACRIKLAVSEEKQTELPDTGIQCPGLQQFEYAIHIHEGSWEKEGLLSKAANYYTPVRSVMTGRGKGSLPLENGLFTINNTNVHVSCVKQAESEDVTIIRLFNPMEIETEAVLNFRKIISEAYLCRMDESNISALNTKQSEITYKFPAKKIITLKIKLQNEQA